MIVESASWKETYETARRMALDARPGMVVALDGEMGAGKTVFTQGFARGLGIEGPVNSPTFLILQVYDSGHLPLYHFDVYRIDDLEEMDEIGYEDYFYGDGVCLVEWAGLIEDLLPEDTVHVRIEKDLKRGFDFRRIHIWQSPQTEGTDEDIGT